MTTKKTETYILSRRGMLGFLGAAGAATLLKSVNWGLFPVAGHESNVAASGPSCIVRPEQTEGPYFVDEMLNRSDIRSDPITKEVKPGVPLRLKINVSRMAGTSCTPLSGALVDIWHCDAGGGYSEFNGLQGSKFLRGYQVTNENGGVEFLTIYPGWYTGRTVHIHFKIRLFTGSQRTYEFTSQLYFDDSVTDSVFTQVPYNARGARNTRNSQDGIFSRNGSQLMPTLTKDSQGYLGTFEIALAGVVTNNQPVITGASVQGKQLIVTGSNFTDGATLLVNGEKQKKTINDTRSPTTSLIARKSGLKITPGTTVALQIKNLEGTLSNVFQFTRTTG